VGRDVDGQPRVMDGDLDGVLEQDLGAYEMAPEVADRDSC
jgi:hypothetical protein